MRSDPEIRDEPDFSTTYPPHCMRGTPGAERIPATRQDWTLVAGQDQLSDTALAAGLEVRRPVVLIHKNSVDVFSNPNTERIVGRLAPQRIVVYGVALDICNRYAIEGLLARGFDRLAVVSDAIKPIDAVKAESLLEDWCWRGVEVLATAELLTALDA